MPFVSKMLIAAGIVLVLVGLVYWGGQKYLHWFGRLPGDIRVEKQNFSLYIPLASMLLISILLSLAMWLIRHFFNK